MKLGILQTGLPPKALQPEFGAYPQMFQQLLGPSLDYRTYDALHGELPGAVLECDAYLITGSRFGVYEYHPWIAPLSEFLRAAKGAAPLVGVCFGHQLMAQAFGGRVAKSDKGWGIGLHAYSVIKSEPWLDGARVVRIAASHQDQVLEPPPGAEAFMASDFTPFAGLTYDDGMSISVQPHPEFDPAYAEALIEARRGDLYAEDDSAKALASFEQPNDRQRVAGWILRFLERSVQARD